MRSITVVVYGLRTPETKLCLDSIRKNLLGAQIVFSTWKGTQTDDLTFDRLVLSEEPDAFIFTQKWGKYNNINKIIVSVSRGLMAVSTNYVLVMRSDMLVMNRNILDFKDCFGHREQRYSLFEKRLFAYEMFSILYEKKPGYKKYFTPFHISDWCYFGLREDVKKLFEIDQVSEPGFSHYFLSHFHNKNIDLWPDRMWRMSPEQYIISSNAAKISGDLIFQDRFDFRESIIEFSTRFIVNNFIIKSIDEWGITIQKTQYKGRNIHSTSTTSDGAWLGKNWILVYRRFCNPAYSLPFRYNLERVFNSLPFAPRISKHYANFVNPLHKCLLLLKSFIRWLGEPLSITFYIIRMICAVLCNFLKRFY